MPATGESSSARRDGTRRAEILRRLSKSPWLPLGPALLFLFVFLVLPLLVTLFTSLQPNILLDLPEDHLGLENYAYIAQTSFYLQVLARTLRICAFTVVFAVLIGYPTAYLLRRYAARLGGLPLLVLSFPMLAGPLVVVLGWMILLADGGPINLWLISLGLIETPLRILRSEIAIVISLVQFTLPFVVLNIFNALSQIDRHLIEAAGGLGAGAWQSFWHVTLPLSLPGVLSASIIAISLAASAFVGPAYLGGGAKLVMTTLIAQVMLGSYNLPLAATIAVVLLVIVLGVIVASNAILTRRTG